MIKRYSSPCAKFTINVKVEGIQKAIVFDRYNADEKRRFIDINDKQVMESMEKSPDFNVYFRLDNTISEPEDEAEKELLLEDVNFKNNNEAKSFLNLKGVPMHKITNAAKIISEGKLLGYKIEIGNF